MPWAGLRNWQDCCGVVGKLPGFNPSPWGYYMNALRIIECTVFEEYMSDPKCPWNEEFEKEWNLGLLAKAVPELIFHEEAKTCTRSW